MSSHTLPALAIYEQETPQGGDWLDRLIARARGSKPESPRLALVSGTVEPEHIVVDKCGDMVAQRDGATFQPTHRTPEGMACVRLLYDSNPWGNRK